MSKELFSEYSNDTLKKEVIILQNQLDEAKYYLKRILNNCILVNDINILIYESKPIFTLGVYEINKLKKLIGDSVSKPLDKSIVNG